LESSDASSRISAARAAEQLRKTPTHHVKTPGFVFVGCSSTPDSGGWVDLHGEDAALPRSPGLSLGLSFVDFDTIRQYANSIIGVYVGNPELCLIENARQTEFVLETRERQGDDLGVLQGKFIKFDIPVPGGAALCQGQTSFFQLALGHPLAMSPRFLMLKQALLPHAALLRASCPDLAQPKLNTSEDQDLAAGRI
jgi:hypothetical protein